MKHPAEQGLGSVWSGNPKSVVGNFWFGSWPTWFDLVGTGHTHRCFGIRSFNSHSGSGANTLFSSFQDLFAQKPCSWDHDRMTSANRHPSELQTLGTMCHQRGPAAAICFPDLGEAARRGPRRGHASHGWNKTCEYLELSGHRGAPKSSSFLMLFSMKESIQR